MTCSALKGKKNGCIRRGKTLRGKGGLRPCIELRRSMSAHDLGGGGGVGREAGIAPWPPLHCRHTYGPCKVLDRQCPACSCAPSHVDVCAWTGAESALRTPGGTLTPENLAALRALPDWSADSQKPPRSTSIRLRAVWPGLPCALSSGVSSRDGSRGPPPGALLEYSHWLSETDSQIRRK